MNKVSAFIDRFEENFIAILLGLMTIITFTQVIARYVFNSGWGSALELTQVLFAWLILFGMSYGVKIGSHLGVDTFIRMFPQRFFRMFALFGALMCIVYAFTLLWADWLQYLGVEQARGGSWKYFMLLFKLNTGMESIIIPDFFPEFMMGGDRLPRWIAYLMLPLGFLLLILRSVQAFIAIWKGEREMIIASHEAEELVEENRNAVKE